MRYKTHGACRPGDQTRVSRPSPRPISAVLAAYLKTIKPSRRAEQRRT